MNVRKMLCYLLLTLCIVFIPQLQVFAEDNVTLYIVKDDNTALRPAPAKSSGVIETLNADTIIACTGTVTNSYGNVWMKTLSGNYIYSERLKECPLKQNGIYSFRNLDTQLYLNLDIDYLPQICDHTRLTLFEYDSNSPQTQLFRIRYISDYQALILAIDNSESFAMNVTYNNIVGSRAEVYHSALNIEPWIIRSPNKYNYTFTLASNNAMLLTAQGNMQNVIIDTEKNSMQTWFLQAAIVDTSNNFIAQTTPPDLNSFYYTRPTNNFLFRNGNCTWYCYGRAMHILGYRPNFTDHAKYFWNYRDSHLYYGYSETVPREGSVVVWDGNSYGNEYGHVAIVEKVNPDGSILISESAYDGCTNGSYFMTREYSSVDALKTIPDPDGYPMPLLGFIYLLPE
ncbi:MAG: CHAP domain-containing protein [Lachnospiraceae bacterium]|nr:CHAP domain-containing protein [Lachnospiraceae bacterium]